MSNWPATTLHRRDVVTVPTIGIAVVLSLLLHLVVIWQWKIQKPPPDRGDPPPLTVQLKPLPGPPPSVAVPPSPQRRSIETPAPRVATITPATPPTAPPLQPPQPKIAPPPVIALTPPTPTAPAPVAPPVRVAPAEDFASFVEAQRRARGEPAAVATAPAEDENARATRQAVANLATAKAQGLGQDPNRSGGIFSLQRKGMDYAEFMFHGWHADARRNMAQLVEVRKGDHSNIELAVVRKMIDIIRVHEQADFQWRSYRLNKSVTLSARQRDSAGLEKFLMDEFFYSPRIAP